MEDKYIYGDQSSTTHIQNKLLEDAELKSKTTIDTQLNEARTDFEEEARQKLTLCLKLRQLEAEQEHLRDRLEEELEAKKHFEKQVAILIAQLTETRTKMEIEAQQAELVEETKKRLFKDLEVLQKEVSALNVVNDKLEKSKKTIAVELENAIVELEAQQLKLLEVEKKQKNFDKILAEEKVVVERTMAGRDAAERDAKEKEALIVSLNRELDESNEKVEDLERIRRQIQIENDELRKNQETTDKTLHELEKTKRSLETQLTEMRSQNDELQDELQLTEDVKLRMEVQVQTSRAQFEKDLQLKDEKRREVAKQFRDLKADLEEERKRRITVTAAKNKLESDFKEIEAQVVFQCKLKEDTAKRLKKSQQQYKEAIREAEEARATRDDLVANLKDTGRKIKSLEVELAQASEDLTVSERARRASDKLQDEISNSSNRESLLVDDKRRLEVRLASLEEELQEEQKNNELLVDKARKSQLLVEQLTSDRASERSLFQKYESGRLLLERQNKELKCKIIELETVHRSKTKAMMESLEMKIVNLEEQLETKVKERFAQQKITRKQGKEVKKLMMQLEDERRHADQYKEQLEKGNALARCLKRQLDETDEEISKEKVQKRKIQREYEDMLESHEVMSRELAELKRKLRRNNAKGVAPSSSHLENLSKSRVNESGEESTTQEETFDT